MTNLASVNERRARGGLRRGTTLVLVAVLIPILFILVGFAIDFANMQRTRTELRVATDLAAKAAAEKLARTGSQAEAIAAGKAIAEQNLVAGDGLTLADDEFEFGVSDQQSSGKWSFGSASSSYQNAVRVNGKRTEVAADGPVSMYFGNLVGMPHFETSMSAAAAFTHVDICLVLDRSCSMKLSLHENTGLMFSDPRFCQPPDSVARWHDLDAAVRVFLNELNTTPGFENVGMVTFGSEVVGAPPCAGDISSVSIDQNLTTNLNNIEAALTARTNSVWNGNTDIAAGMQTGITVLQGSRTGSHRFMILLTDGQYTEDNPVPWATTAASNDIVIHTVTFGNLPTDPGDTWIADMQQIAADTGGSHLHAPDAQSLIDAFEHLATSAAMLIQ